MHLDPLPNADRDVVVAMAEARLNETPGMEPEAAARAVLQEVYGLDPRDGIYTGSLAAIRMGWGDRSGDEDVMDEIVEFVAERLQAAPAPRR